MAAKKILIIEDDSDIRSALREILELEQMTVVEAGNGQQGLDHLGAHVDVRVILLDMMMPIMDGWEFLERIKAKPEWSRIPIIAISAAGLKPSSVKADLFLKKPLDLDMLLEAIQRFV